MGVINVIFLIMFTLKLTGTFTGSWWIVFSPLILQAVIVAALTTVAYYD